MTATRATLIQKIEAYGHILYEVQTDEEIHLKVGPNSRYCPFFDELLLTHDDLVVLEELLHEVVVSMCERVVRGGALLPPRLRALV